MFNKEDFFIFVDQLFQIELEMEREAKELMDIIDIPEAKELLMHIINDEMKHQNIVNEMRWLV